MSRGFEFSTEQQMAKRDALIKRLDEELDECTLPVRDDDSIRYWFYCHANRLYKETSQISGIRHTIDGYPSYNNLSLRQIEEKVSYQCIIGLGYQAVPLLLEQLNHDPERWFLALSMIVGENMAFNAETTLEARQMWLTWAQQENLMMHKSGSHEEK